MQTIVFIIFMTPFIFMLYVAIEMIKNDIEAKKTIKNSKLLETGDYEEIKSFYTKIAGVTFGNAQSNIARLKSGDSLNFKREPNNKYDPNAIAVRKDSTKLGHLSSDIAQDIAPLIDSGCLIFGKVKNVTGGYNGKSFGCNIEITIWATPEYIKSTKPANPPKRKTEEFVFDPNLDTSNPLYGKKCVFYIIHDPYKSNYINNAKKLGAKTTQYVSSKTDYFVIDDPIVLTDNESTPIIKYNEAIGRNPNIKLLFLDKFKEICQEYLPKEN